MTHIIIDLNPKPVDLIGDLIAQGGLAPDPLNGEDNLPGGKKLPDKDKLLDRLLNSDDDSLLWMILLSLAREKVMREKDRWKPQSDDALMQIAQLCRNLEGFRVEGTRIVKLDNGNYALRPVIVCGNTRDPAALFLGWQSEADYKRYAAKFLRPYHELLVELLGELQAVVAGLEAESETAEAAVTAEGTKT